MDQVERGTVFQFKIPASQGNWPTGGHPEYRSREVTLRFPMLSGSFGDPSNGSQYFIKGFRRVFKLLILLRPKIPQKREHLIDTMNRLILVIPPPSDNALIINATRDPMDLFFNLNPAFLKQYWTL